MAITGGNNLNSVPTSQKQTLSSNYLDLAGTTNEGWAQQYLPDLMEKEAEVFGPRTISGFLSQVGAEESMTADQVVWSEQGKADAVKDTMAKDKNISVDPRQSHSESFVGGIKVRALGESTSDFKFKIKNKK